MKNKFRQSVSFKKYYQVSYAEVFLGLRAVNKHLNDNLIAIIEGPFERIGAKGALLSVSFRDLDQNLIEVSNYI